MSMVGKIFWAVVLAVFFLMVFDLGWRQYQVWKDQQAVEELKQALEQTEAERERRMEEDTAGGNTPQETLDLYIEAVEVGDYELASKYFVIEKQEEELENLQKAYIENIDIILGVLKQTELVDLRKELEESYDLYGPGYGTKRTKEEYVEDMLEIYSGKATMTTEWEGYDFDVSFILYPSGNWKIEEI